MDPVAEIKARLPIEELVRQYTQLTKKGRNFVALCPFHHDTRPSLLVSPDKGIAYCFPCQKGGDIFSFYQAIENVDFPQALKELAEKVGVKIESKSFRPEAKDEKERLRECLDAAAKFYRTHLVSSVAAKEYLEKRGVNEEEKGTFEIGYAPEGNSLLYEHLLKTGFSRKEIITAGLAIQRDLKDERAFDRFRGRIMFPIRDIQERLIGFGGRTIIGDDAKYMNTSDSPLYRKSSVLYGLADAKDAMRAEKAVIVVEGYFDALACHRVSAHHVVATCGTALTEEHARLLKRYVDTVILCLDSDRAGRAAAERAFVILTRAELQVRVIVLPKKDPADTVLEDPTLLKKLLTEGSVPYIQSVFDDIRASAASSPDGKRAALERLLVIYEALPTTTERMAFLRDAGPAMGMTESQLESDLQQFASHVSSHAALETAVSTDLFTSAEIALGLFLLSPRLRHLLPELIAPEEGMAAILYEALKNLPEDTLDPLASMELPDDMRERIRILQLFCEEHGFGEWGESLAAREIRKNCQHANREVLRRKQFEITRRLTEARKEGKLVEEELLRTQYQQLLKLAKMAS